jgi:competence protein ComFB
MQLENLRQIHDLVQDPDKKFCRCRVCLQDMAAIVLNRVPALYSCSILEKNSPGEDFSERIEAVRKRIAQELPEAMELVRRNNNH